ncbi:MAG: ACT domain-containing protein [Proteobacteria bacterium]|nr:ACT domain-containing protein [Pseudomonadota bacterium]
MKKIIITIIGPDKPGIIASVSDTLFKKGCNIENVSQTTLQSEFAGICVVSIPEDLTIETLRESMNKDLEGKGLHVHIKALEDAEPALKESAESFIISTCGPDKKGLVARISKVIAEAGVNISNLKAVFEGGTNPDRNIMIFEVDVPGWVDVQALSVTLKHLASELNLDLTLQHKNIFDAVNRI